MAGAGWREGSGGISYPKLKGVKIMRLKSASGEINGNGADEKAAEQLRGGKRGTRIGTDRSIRIDRSS
jgi:hypothetical protein